MSKWSLLALCLVATVFAGSATAGVEVGDMGPNYKFDKSWNMPEGVTQLDDFRGKLVMVERWATWCGPCMAGIPHLQELHDHFAAKGLQIVATSDEDVNTIQSGMINTKKPTYGVVRADIGNLYQTDGIPHCWVLDAEGKCIYKGHPGNVTVAMVEGWVKDIPPATIEKEVAKELKGAVGAFNKGELGKSLAELEKVEASATDEAVKADAAFVRGYLEKRVSAISGKITKAEEAGDLVAKGKALQEGAELFKGSSRGEEWGNQLTELEKSHAYKDTVKAGEELEKLRPKLDDMKASSAKKALEKIAKKYPDTTSGKEAAELAKRYE
jgi:thiol-disulfide isomerase/thioredoxin